MTKKIKYLHKLIDSEYPKICFGSSGKYWQVGSYEWEQRCDLAFNSIVKNGQVPYIHMLRGLNMAGKRWPFASADSVNVARNYKDKDKDPEKMAQAMNLGVQAGRLGYLAGRMEKKHYANASSPLNQISSSF